VLDLKPLLWKAWFARLSVRVFELDDHDYRPPMRRMLLRFSLCGFLAGCAVGIWSFVAPFSIFDLLPDRLAEQVGAELDLMARHFFPGEKGMAQVLMLMFLGVPLSWGAVGGAIGLFAGFMRRARLRQATSCSTGRSEGQSDGSDG
jgi:hypothetical protein